MLPTATREREFAFSDQDFRRIAERLYAEAGIVLRDHKRDMVYGRLARRIRELGLPSFAAYLERLEGPDGADELGVMINALTTNLTSFFREAHHFEHLRTIALPDIGRAAAERKRRLRLWSSACSSGEEPYNMAISLLASGVDLGGWDVRILASDLDTNMLARAQEGEYRGEALRTVPDELRARYFDRLREADALFSVKPAVRRLVTFKQLNLLEAWPMRGPFDVIFCRNVLIYFDAPTKARLVQRFVELLRPGGWLYLGHSESLLGGPAELHAVGRTTYRRTG